MKLWTMRLIDYWLGRPLCLLLTIWNRLLGLILGSSLPTDPPQKMVFIKLEEQGALVLASVAVQRAIAMVGRENIYFCVFAENCAILHALELVPRENVLTIRTQTPVQVGLDTLRVLARLRRIGVDTAIDLEFFSRGSAILTYLCGARRRVGLHSFNDEMAYRGDLMTHRVAHNPYLHTADAYDVLVRAMTESPEETPLLKKPAHPETHQPPHYTPVATALETVQRHLPPGDGPLFILHPNCSDILLIRKWPSARYVELSKRIREQWPDARIVISGLELDRAEAARIASEIGGEGTCALAGDLSFIEFLALLTLGDVLVTNDSGPAHFASTTPIHQVVLFGPETPTIFGPLGARTRVLYRQLACSPCVTTYNYRRSACNNNVCVQSITVEEVFDTITECMAERGTHAC